MNHQKGFLGFGLGLRPEYYEEILSAESAVDWFEIVTENYLVPGGKPHYYLEQIRERYPVVMHGVSMSIGSADAIDYDYLAQVKKLSETIRPQWISDHLCWTGVDGVNMHDLLPLPYTQEAVSHVADRIAKIQDYLGQQILIENVSSYITYQQSEMTEWEFISEITTAADCLLLLDVNNVYVSAVNHQFNALDFIHGIPAERVQQIHIAGHTNMGNYIIDTHDNDVIEPVWDLYAKTLEHVGLVSTMIERDDNFPSYAELVSELQHARKIAQPICDKVVTP